MRARILLLWLLALAIPVQGFAAVVQSGCAPVVVQAASGHGSHKMHNMHTMDHMDHAMVEAAADHASSQHASHKAGSSCSSCATCNIGAVLPLSLATPPAPVLPSHRYLTQRSSGFVGYTPENPDRPPAFA